ncbi:hypothetical protein HBB16_11215, partial [Pseudonocardia sp. MCCB 268]|nr:hypothetical protein [Pseudonocardia cytotoxica]
MLEALAEIDTVVLVSPPAAAGRGLTPLGDRSAGDVLAGGRGQEGSEHVLGRAVRRHALERGSTCSAVSGFGRSRARGARSSTATGRGRAARAAHRARRAGHRAGRRGAGRERGRRRAGGLRPAGVVASVRRAAAEGAVGRSRRSADRRHAGGPSPGVLSIPFVVVCLTLAIRN